MNPWLFPWWGFFKSPLSGDVNQEIAPNMSWLSPQFEFSFAGDRRIESDVVSDVASYGKQLGILSEAVLELAEDTKGKDVTRLRELVAQIEAVKQRHADTLTDKVKAQLDQLRSEDPQALQQLLADYRNG